MEHSSQVLDRPKRPPCTQKLLVGLLHGLEVVIAKERRPAHYLQLLCPCLLRVHGPAASTFPRARSSLTGSFLCPLLLSQALGLLLHEVRFTCSRTSATSALFFTLLLSQALGCLLLHFLPFSASCIFALALTSTRSLPAAAVARGQRKEFGVLLLLSFGLSAGLVVAPPAASPAPLAKAAALTGRHGSKEREPTKAQ